MNSNTNSEQKTQPPPGQDRPAERDPPKQQPRRDRPQRLCRRRPSEVLVFSPLAWAKLMFFLHAGDTEVGGFAVTAEADPLYVEDFVTVRQRVTAVSVAFDDEAVADHFDACVDAGLRPERFARIWIHTHPGHSPEPSMTDEETFARVFGSCDWAVMFIVSRTHRAYARLSFRAGPGGEVLLDVAVDWGAWPQLVLEDGDGIASQMLAWAEEYERNVLSAVPVRPAGGNGTFDLNDLWWDLDEHDAAAAAAAWLGCEKNPLPLFGGEKGGEVPA